MSATGHLFREARVAAGKTLASSAADLGVSISYVCDVEYGRRELTLAKVLEWCEYYDIDAAPHAATLMLKKWPWLTTKHAQDLAMLMITAWKETRNEQTHYADGQG